MCSSNLILSRLRVLLQTVSQGRGAGAVHSGAVAAVRPAELVHGVRPPAETTDHAVQRRPPDPDALVQVVSSPRITGSGRTQHCYSQKTDVGYLYLPITRLASGAPANPNSGGRWIYKRVSKSFDRHLGWLRAVRDILCI